MAPEEDDGDFLCRLDVRRLENPLDRAGWNEIVGSESTHSALSILADFLVDLLAAVDLGV